MAEPMDSMSDCRTLPERIWHWATQCPEKTAFTVLNAEGMPESALSYGELYRRAVAVGSSLAQADLKGRNAVLMYSPGTEFISTFLGCMLAGIVPVPVHGPKSNRSNAKILGSIAGARAGALLMDQRMRLAVERVADRAAWPADIPFIDTDQIVGEDRSLAFDRPLASPSELALLQFTSGSTSAPKGVAITHGNLGYNIEMLTRCMQTSSASVFVCWVPHFHDLGLVCNLIQCLYVGAHGVLLAPSTFIANPLVWLRAIQAHRGTHVTAPNFAYQRCVNKVSPRDRDALDLSSLKVAVNAGEPIHHQTIVEFTDYFRSAGFDPVAFMPGYGMAEATVFITGAHANQLPRLVRIDRERYTSERRAVLTENTENSLVLVGCGRCTPEQEVKIVDPLAVRALQAGEVGEIWIAGDHVMAGYYERPEADAEVFAILPQTGRRYFRTGDLGFVDASGELFVSGRRKDLIIVGGVNYYPQDIERVVEKAHADVHPTGAAAFAVPGGATERLVVVAEVAREAVARNRKSSGGFVEMARALCEEVSREFEISVSQVVLLRPGHLPKTSSGKVARQECRKAYLDGSFDALVTWPDAKPAISEPAPSSVMHNVEKALRAINRMSVTHLQVFSQLLQILSDELKLNLADIDVDKSIFFYGIDSIRLVDIHGALEQRLGYAIPTEAFFRSATLIGTVEEIAASGRAEANRIDGRRLREDIELWLGRLTEQFNATRAAKAPQSSANDAILLTGATGYLGIYLLQELLHSTPQEIYCLARAMDEKTGWRRIEKNMERYGLQMPEDWRSRVKIVIGDTTKEYLGLAPEVYQAISRRVGSVHHCAAIDNFYLPYEIVKNTNVIGTVHIAQFCMHERVKPLYYVSSCATRLLNDNRLTTETTGLVNGYAQAKYVAERVVLGLIERGFPAINYRLGYLYSLQADMADTEEAFETMLTAMFQLRCIPHMDAVFDLTPVEYAAKCIAKTALEDFGEGRQRDYTFQNPVPVVWADVCASMLELCPDLQTVTLGEFADRFQDYVRLSDRRNVKLLKSVVSERLEQQLNDMFRAVPNDDIGLVEQWCPPGDRTFAAHYLELVLGSQAQPRAAELATKLA